MTAAMNISLLLFNTFPFYINLVHNLSVCLSVSKAHIKPLCIFLSQIFLFVCLFLKHILNLLLHCFHNLSVCLTVSLAYTYTSFILFQIFLFVLLILKQHDNSITLIAILKFIFLFLMYLLTSI
jgi:hypothetical protein